MKKKCSVCLELMDVDAFHKKEHGKYGVAKICKECTSDWMKEYYSKPDIKEKIRKRDAARFICNLESLSDKEAARRRRKADALKHTYGITLNEYEIMLVKQKFKCAICGLKVPEKPYSDHASKMKNTLCVDHTHNSGEIRSLLCGECNRSLGGFKEDISILENAISYLRRHT